MLISNDLFDELYRDQYLQLLEEAKYYIANPSVLKAKIANGTQPTNRLKNPSVDEYFHKMTYYRGFVAYPNRLKNYIVSQNDERGILRNYLPTIMDLEPNSSCNFRCTMCQVSNWEKGKRADDMCFEDFKLFMDENSHFMEVKLHGMGEPLLHKRYFEMVEYLSSQHIWTRTSINGSLLHLKENYKRLIDAEIGEVQCSFDGATKDVYESIRINANFDQVVNNLTQLNKYANLKERLYTRMWALIQKSNRHQIFEFVELAAKMNFRRLSFSASLNDWGREEWNQNNKEKEAKRFSDEEHQKLIELSKKYGIDITLWEQGSSYDATSKEKLCSWVFNRPYISSDLKVVPCCMIADPSVVNFGDAKDFGSVWNNQAYQNFRQLHLDGNIPDCCKLCYSS